MKKRTYLPRGRLVKKRISCKKTYKTDSTGREVLLKSGLELTIFKQLKAKSKPIYYEPISIEYTSPVKKYRPDFILDNGIIIEVKGYFESKDRSKHLRVKKQHPQLDIRFVFQNPQLRLSKASKTTYAKWCEKHGFKYSTALIPDSWLNERTDYSICLKSDIKLNMG